MRLFVELTAHAVLFLERLLWKHPFYYSVVGVGWLSSLSQCALDAVYSRDYSPCSTGAYGGLWAVASRYLSAMTHLKPTYQKKLIYLKCKLKSCFRRLNYRTISDVMIL